MKSELIPQETPLLIDGKISEWLEEQPETPVDELTMLIGIRSESGGIYRILMVSPEEYEIACAFFVNKLLMVDELQDISTRLAGCDAIYKTRAIRRSLLDVG